MKKIFFVCVVLTFALGAAAQEKQAPKSSWFVGPRLGVSVSTVTDKAIESSSVGFTGGLFGEYKHACGFAVELDVLYSAQGVGGTEVYDNLLVPLKLKYYIPYTKGLNVFVGPQLDLMLGNPTNILGWVGGVVPPMRTTSVSVVAGLGYRFNFGLELTANYNAGLLSVLDIETSQYRPSVFQFTVRYDVFRFGAK